METHRTRAASVDHSGSGIRWEVGVVADDLTGAADTAVQFEAAGWPTLLLLERPGRPTAGAADRPLAADQDGVVGQPGALALTTDARALEADQASAASGAAIESLLAQGVSRLYIKVDSTLRGTVGAQITAALTTWRRHREDAFAVLCPAYPAMGRTVCAGRLLVHGSAAHESSAGTDPVAPLRTAALAELVPGSRHVPLPTAGTTHDRARALTAEMLRVVGAAPGPALLTVDAATDTDLDVVGGALSGLDGRALPVGSAGLARTLALAWRDSNAGDVGAQALSLPGAFALPPCHAHHAGPPRPVVVLVTSLHQVARAQLAYLRTGTSVHDRLDVDVAAEELVDEDAFARWGDALAAVDPVPPLVVLAAAPDAASPPGKEAQVVAARMAGLAALLHGRQALAGVVVTGGDGAGALAHHLGATAIRILGEVAPGLPHGVLVGGRASGLPIITKAGGFGVEDTLLVAARATRDRDSMTAKAPVEGAQT